jgi:hypothetical protein
MPFDSVADNHRAGALHVGSGIRGCQLRHVPYDHGLGRGIVRSQHYRIHADRHAHVADADGLCRLPYQQQLQPEFRGLLRLPCSRLPEHHYDWRKCSKPRHGRIPNYGIGLRYMPSNYDLGGWRF